jgi:hypothetical protein
MARATHRDGGTHLGSSEKRALTDELVRGDMGRRRGIAAVEVDHGPGEAVRWTVRSTERLQTSKRWRQGRKMTGVARSRQRSVVKMDAAPDVAELMGERGGDEVGGGGGLLLSVHARR